MPEMCLASLDRRLLSNTFHLLPDTSEVSGKPHETSHVAMSIFGQHGSFLLNSSVAKRTISVGDTEASLFAGFSNVTFFAEHSNRCMNGPSFVILDTY